MTYAYDDYVQMPTKDLYDTAVMKMAIEAAKDMYDKGQAQMENFYKTYGDFMSPFAKDMELYGAAMDNIRQTVNDAYARGIDLFKSPEGSEDSLSGKIVFNSKTLLIASCEIHLKTTEGSGTVKFNFSYNKSFKHKTPNDIGYKE